MPQQQIVPTWLAWNNCNFPTQSGIQDLRTGQDFPAGGLNLGDYFDATEQEANSASALSIGQLHWGRYRLVQVDSGATPANVKTGTVGFSRSGTFVQGTTLINLGSGGTPGTYTVPVPAGFSGGSGCVLQIVVGPSGAISAVYVLQGGMNYFYANLRLNVTGIPGLTGAQLSLQLNSTPNLVTSVDQAYTALGNSYPPRAIFFLNSITPGNFGFVQELGLATGLAQPSTNIAPSTPLTPNASNDGTLSPLTSFGTAQVGTAIDYTTSAVVLTLFKLYMNGVPVCQD